MMTQDEKENNLKPDAELEKTQILPKSAAQPAKKDEEATQVIGVVEDSAAEKAEKGKITDRPYQPGTKPHDVSEDTQSLPRINEETPIQQPFPQQGTNPDGVRELPPDKDLQQQNQPQQNWLQAHKRKAALLAGGFLVAVFLGFMLAGYTQHKEEAKNQQYMQQQAMQNKQDDLNRQEEDLKQQRKELEQRKQDLQDRERALEEQSSRAKGRNEALNEDKSSSSTLDKIIDKVTGKDDERDQSIQKNKETSAQADTNVDDVKQSINEAQQKLDSVNQKLDSVSSMKQEAGSIADKAKDTYDENKGTIDTALDYAKAGAQLLVNWLTD